MKSKNKKIRLLLTIIFIQLKLILTAYSESPVFLGDYPCLGLSLESVGGLGALSENDEYGGVGLFGDIGIRINFKLVNELYAIKKNNDFYPVTSNFLNIFGFAKIKDRFYVDINENTNIKTKSFNDNIVETLIGGGLCLEIPNFGSSYKSGVFFEPNIGFDFYNQRTEIDLYAGIDFDVVNCKYLDVQGNVGIGAGGFIYDEKIHLNDFMVFLGLKLDHDFNHIKYCKIVENFKMEAIKKQKEYDEYLTKKKEEEQRKQAEEQKKYDNYKKNYTIYKKFLYPLLLGKSAIVITLNGSNSNFIRNSPYSFEETFYYSIESYAGEVLQWLDKGTCLFSFRGSQYYGYGSTSTGLAYIHFNSSITDFPFDKMNVIYKYTGVYEYITANGSLNTVPKFEAVFSVGNY